MVCLPRGLVLQVVAGRRLVDGLQVDVTIFVDAGEDDFVDVIIEDENLNILLLINLEKRLCAE